MPQWPWGTASGAGCRAGEGGRSRGVGGGSAGYQQPCMRTSPSHVRRPLAPRAVPLILIAALVVSGTACGDDGGEQTTPTTTSPATTESAPSTAGGEGSTTTTVPGVSTDPSGATTPSPATEGALTDDQVRRELRRLFDGYRDAFRGARARGALDEQFRAELSAVFAPALRNNEISGLETIGGVAAIVPEPSTIPIDGVVIDVSTPSCVSGSATFDLRAVVGNKVPGPREQFFKLERSDASADGSWRVSAFGFTPDGQAFAGATCEEA